MTGDEAAARAALREVVEAYALAADARDAAGAAALFAHDGRAVLWLDPDRAEPTGSRTGRDEIATMIGGLGRFRATHHTISSAAFAVDGDRATGVTMCVAHHLETADGGLNDRVLFIRYDDTFVRVDGRWLFGSRELRVQWSSVVPVSP